MKGKLSSSQTQDWNVLFNAVLYVYKKKGPKASPYVFELTELRDGKLAGEFSLLPL